MKIHCLVVTQDGPDESWLLTAWDEWTLDNDYQGWEEELQKARKKYREIREAIIEVPDGFLSDAFKIHSTKGKVTDG